MTPEAVSKELKKILDAAPVDLRTLAKEAGIPYGRLRKLVSPPAVKAQRYSPAEDLPKLAAALQRIAPKLRKAALKAADRVDKLSDVRNQR